MTAPGKDARVAAGDIDQARLILLEDGHCLRDQALAFCATATRGARPGQRHDVRRQQSEHGDADGRGRRPRHVDLYSPPTSKRRDARGEIFAPEDPEPGRSIGLVFRRTSPRKADFAALGEVVKEKAWASLVPAAAHT